MLAGSLALLVLAAPTVRAAPGDLDTGFSSDGKVLTDIAGSSTDIGRAVAVQSDGKIVVAGYALVGASYDFAVVRYNTDGSLDTGFDSDGRATIDVNSSHELGYGVAIQSDGKIVVVGASGYGGVNPDFGVVRLDTDGSLDTSFSGDGKVSLGVGSGTDYAFALDVASDGDIVVVGYGHNGADWDVAVIRLDSSGNLDTAFSSDGKALYDIGSGTADHGYAVDVADDGDLLIAGDSGGDALAMRLTAAGVLDTAFSSDGIVTASVGTADVGYGIVEAADGDVIVGGSAKDGDEEFLVLRFTASGAADTSFSSDGIHTVDLTGNDDVGYGIVEQADGSVVVAGSSNDGSKETFGIVRLTATGSLDTDFSGDGTLTTAFGSNDAEPYGLAVTAGGKVVVAGKGQENADTDFAVAVYEGASAPGAPTGLSGTAGDGQVALSWTAPSDNGGAAVTGYKVESSTNGGSSWSTVTADTGSTSTSYTATGLTNGTAHTFRVSGVNAVGAGTASSTASATPVTTPGVPTSLSGAAGDGQVALSWTAPGDNGGAAITGYQVESSTDGETWSTVTADTGSSTASYTATGLTNGTAYTFRASAINSVGTGTVSSTASATPRTTPGAPTSLAGTPGDQQVALTWTAPSSDGGSAVTGYRVESSTNGGSSWSTVVADTGSSTASYTATGLTNGTAHTFRVSAINAAGTGTASGTASATPRTTPGSSTSLAGIPADGEVSLSWSAPSSDGGSALTGYRVESSTNGGTTWSTAIADTGSTSTSAVVDGLSNGTATAFRVSAINAAGIGSASDSTTATPRTTPGAPGSLAATEDSAQVALSWTAPSSDGGSAVTGYQVESSTNSGLSWSTVVADTGSTSTSYAATGLTNGTAYTFRVSAINAAGTGPASSSVTATPRTTTDAPTGLAATPGDRQAALAWTAPSDTGGSTVTGYRVERSTDDGTTWATLTADTGSTSTSYTATGLANGTAYAFRVSAVNDAGAGTASSTASTTPRTTPDAPTGVAAEVGDARSSLSWTAPSSDGGSAVTGYRVERSADGGTTWDSVVDDTASTSTTYTVTGLDNGTTYAFRVSAVNAAGTGSASSSASGTPVAPSTSTSTTTTTTTTAVPTASTTPAASTTPTASTTTAVPSTSTIGSTSTTSTTSVAPTASDPSAPPPLPPMTIIDGRLYQDGGIPLPPTYLG
ncbi:MAG: fibronectin type III domain-containing protein [Acidimicrobiales bacterium]|nr:fibronectin type III domain-containing protein [Acidimicrobiales bacterium]